MGVERPVYSTLCDGDSRLYSEYLFNYKVYALASLGDGCRGCVLAGWQGVLASTVGANHLCGRGGGSDECDAHGDAAGECSSIPSVDNGDRQPVRAGGSCVDLLEDRRSGREGDVFNFGRVASVNGGGGPTFDGSGVACGLSSDDVRVGDNDGSSRSSGFPLGVKAGVAPVRGVNFERNNAKRIRRKLAKARAKVDGSGGCVSDSDASVCTVDTRTAVEIEAAQTLAARRVAENRLATVKAQVQIRSYADKAKTDAYQRLSEARMEQRINEAKAKSQASFKKCDESLKSLGSTGSAGEFAMRREVAKARESEAMLKYVQAQADILARHATPQTLALCNEVPPPERVNLFEIFGECSSDLSPDEIENYYEQIRILEEEQDALFTTQFA